MRRERSSARPALNQYTVQANEIYSESGGPKPEDIPCQHGQPPMPDQEEWIAALGYEWKDSKIKF